MLHHASVVLRLVDDFLLGSSGLAALRRISIEDAVAAAITSDRSSSTPPRLSDRCQAIERLFHFPSLVGLVLPSLRGERYFFLRAVFTRECTVSETP